MGTAAAIVGGSLISGLFANKAAGKQAKQTRKAIDAQNALLGPFAQAGTQGLGAVQNFVDQGANFSDTQAFKDIVNTQKARGQNLSGNTLTSLADYYATNFRPERLQELSFLPTLGANAAAGQATNIGNLRQSLGATQAGGTLGVGNAINSGINSLAFLNLANRQNAGTVNNGDFLRQAGLGGG